MKGLTKKEKEEIYLAEELSKTSRPGFWQWLHEWIWDLIFAINFGATADFDNSWCMAGKYAELIVRRRTRKKWKVKH